MTRPEGYSPESYRPEDYFPEDQSPEGYPSEAYQPPSWTRSHHPEPSRAALRPLVDTHKTPYINIGDITGDITMPVTSPVMRSALTVIVFPSCGSLQKQRSAEAIQYLTTSNPLDRGLGIISPF